MIDTEGLDDLLADLAEFGQELQETTTTTLQDLAANLPNQLRNQIFSKKQNRTGNLNSSIKATAGQNTISLEMAYYGYFQVFGVSGTNVSAFGLPASVLESLTTTPNGGNSFAFRKIKHPGIFGVQEAADTITGLEDLIVNTLLED